MNIPPTPPYIFPKEITRAFSRSQPVVALESTVITHGLPRPENLKLARDVEGDIRDEGAIPVTIAILNGKIHVGLTNGELEHLASDSKARKVGKRDLAAAMISRSNGGTTVSGTLFIAHQAGIAVLATGGIGGVHPQPARDISTDLTTLAETPMIVVCAGAKAILDIPATLEYLETIAVPVIGYRTDEFPAFYSVESGLPVNIRLNSPGDIVKFAANHWGLGLKSAILVAQPPPASSALPGESVEQYIQQAQHEAEQKSIHGQALTPFLLKRLTELSNGATLRVNLELLRNNARLAAKIAVALSSSKRQRDV